MRLYLCLSDTGRESGHSILQVVWEYFRKSLAMATKQTDVTVTTTPLPPRPVFTELNLGETLRTGEAVPKTKGQT